MGHEGFPARLGAALEIRGIFKDPASLYRQQPPGWKYRTRVLDQDLIMIPQTGIATIMPDEFFNAYDKTGPGRLDR